MVVFGSRKRWDRWHIIPQPAVYTTYIPLLYIAFWGVICYLPPFTGTRNNHWNMISGHLIPIRTLQNTPWVSTAHMLSLPGRDFSQAGHLKLLKLPWEFLRFWKLPCELQMYIQMIPDYVPNSYFSCLCWRLDSLFLFNLNAYGKMTDLVAPAFSEVVIYENTLLKNHVMQFHHHSKSFTPPRSLCHIFFFGFIGQLVLFAPARGFSTGPHGLRKSVTDPPWPEWHLSIPDMCCPWTRWWYLIQFSRETRCNPDLFNFLLTFLTPQDKNKMQARWKDCAGKIKQNDKTYSNHSAKIQSPS